MRLAYGPDRHEICRSAELRSGDRLLHATDESAARDLLRGLLSDAAAMARIRRLLLEDSFRDLSTSSDHEVIDVLARRVASGRLRVVSSEAQRPPAIPAVKVPVITEAPPPAPERTRAPAPPPPEAKAPAPAPATVGMTAQAEALTLAARDGTPFCEECAKYRAEQAQQAAF
jgi:hypothetical protein